jgi:hypothetical protein
LGIIFGNFNLIRILLESLLLFVDISFKIRFDSIVFSVGIETPGHAGFDSRSCGKVHVPCVNRFVFDPVVHASVETESMRVSESTGRQKSSGNKKKPQKFSLLNIRYRYRFVHYQRSQHFLSSR